MVLVDGVGEEGRGLCGWRGSKLFGGGGWVGEGEVGGRRLREK